MTPLPPAQKFYQCFVCSLSFSDYNQIKEHIFNEHEEIREYIRCPLPYCQSPVRDLRIHFKSCHPKTPIPQGIQMKATIWYDCKSPAKKKKVVSFKDGTLISAKNNNKPMHYRSGYEKEVYECLERDGAVLSYSVEPFYIPYYYGGKERRYFPDLKIHFADGRVEIWEIKPATQTKNSQNTAKWKSCEHYCLLRGWKFNVITEQEITELKNKTRAAK